MRRRLHKTVDGQELKYCGICKAWKIVDEFGKSSRNWDNLKNKCKICRNKTERIYRNTDRERRRKLGRDHEVNRKLRKQKAESARNWRINNPERCRETKRIYNKRNREKLNEMQRKWIAKNIERVRERYRKRQQQKRLEPKYRLNSAVSRGIWKCLQQRKNGWHWEILVGWTLKDLVRHLERHFLPGMTWKNWGKGKGKWNIDHTIPINAFNFKNPNHLDFERCWALKNLKPMWSENNLRKHAKLEKAFQPSLSL